MRYIILILTTLLISHTAVGQLSEVQSNNNNVTLIIKPHICVVPRNKKSCISTIDITWLSQKADDYCLSVEKNDENLQCWQNSTSGYYQHKLIFDKNILYHMKTQQKIVAQSLMKLKTMKPHRKFNRRRNRFPWSLN